MKRGRPEEPWDYDTVAKLAAIGCSDKEIAGVLGKSPSTFSKRKQKDPGLTLALERGVTQRDVNIRAWTFKAAARLNWRALAYLNAKYFPEEQPERRPEPAAQEVPVGLVLPAALTVQAYHIVIEDMRSKGLLPGDGGEERDLPLFAPAAASPAEPETECEEPP